MRTIDKFKFRLAPTDYDVGYGRITWLAPSGAEFFIGERRILRYYAVEYGRIVTTDAADLHAVCMTALHDHLYNINTSLFRVRERAFTFLSLARGLIHAESMPTRRFRHNMDDQECEELGELVRTFKQDGD